jgi:hypothetical protein
MYKTVLVKELVEEGEELIKLLESHRFQIAAAFWYYFEDLMRWRLVIVFSTLVKREGPLRAYMHIQEALAQMQAKELLVSDISVMRPNGYEFEELRSAVERSGRVATRHPMSTPRDIVFERAYVYRWSDQLSKSYRT